MGRAQFAMEYLLVVGFSLAVIIPVTALLYGEYQDSRTELNLEHLTELARELVFQAEKIYYQGAPSATTVEASFPTGVTSARVTETDVAGTKVYTVTFELGSTDIVVYADSKVPLQPVTLRAHPGPHVITLIVDDQGTISPDDDRVVMTDR